MAKQTPYCGVVGVGKVGCFLARDLAGTFYRLVFLDGFGVFHLGVAHADPQLAAVAFVDAVFGETVVPFGEDGQPKQELFFVIHVAATHGHEVDFPAKAGKLLLHLLGAGMAGVACANVARVVVPKIDIGASGLMCAVVVVEILDEVVVLMALILEISMSRIFSLLFFEIWEDLVEGVGKHEMKEAKTYKKKCI